MQYLESLMGLELNPGFDDDDTSRISDTLGSLGAGCLSVRFAAVCIYFFFVLRRADDDEGGISFIGVPRTRAVAAFVDKRVYHHYCHHRRRVENRERPR